MRLTRPEVARHRSRSGAGGWGRARSNQATCVDREWNDGTSNETKYQKKKAKRVQKRHEKQEVMVVYDYPLDDDDADRYMEIYGARYTI